MLEYLVFKYALDPITIAMAVATVAMTIMAIVAIIETIALLMQLFGRLCGVAVKQLPNKFSQSECNPP
jgi:hypothetical protein